MTRRPLFGARMKAYATTPTPITDPDVIDLLDEARTVRAEILAERLSVVERKRRLEAEFRGLQWAMYLLFPRSPVTMPSGFTIWVIAPRAVQANREIRAVLFPPRWLSRERPDLVARRTQHNAQRGEGRLCEQEQQQNAGEMNSEGWT